jgi:hypothetical protein
MAVSLEEQVARLTTVVLRQRAQMTLLDIALRSLFVTHPSPERLRAAFENAGTRLLDHAVNSRYEDDILEELRNLYLAYLRLTDIAPRDRDPGAGS